MAAAGDGCFDVIANRPTLPHNEYFGGGRIHNI